MRKLVKLYFTQINPVNFLTYRLTSQLINILGRIQRPGAKHRLISATRSLFNLNNG